MILRCDSYNLILQCQFVAGRGFRAGNYECHCKPGFYFPFLNSTQRFYTGTQVERHFLQSIRNDSNVTSDEFQCLPCRQGCIGCDDDSPCFVEYNILMRGIPLGIQSFCMTITLVLGIVILRLRKCKVSDIIYIYIKVVRTCDPTPLLYKIWQ